MDNILLVFLLRILFLIIGKRYQKAVINLDAVTRYCGFVTCRHRIILMMLYVTRHFTTQVGTMSIGRETFRHRLIAESRLRIAMDCGRGSLVKLCGLRWIKFRDLHTSVDRIPHGNGNSIVSLRPVLPATHIVVS